MKIFLVILGFLVCLNSYAAVTLPYTYGSNVPPSQANANDQALRDEINSHESAHNGHNTALSDTLAVNSSVGSYSINFNGKELFNALVEKVSSDPACSSTSTVKGRLIFNTVDGLLKFCDGSSFVSIAGTGVNTLSSVLAAGNSAGSTDLNMNSRQLKAARVENLGSDPSPGSAGRVFWNTATQLFKIDTGSAIQALGGTQNMASVLTAGNSAGSTNLDMNGNQILNFKAEVLASDPSSATARVYYNSTSNKLKFYNGSSWLEVGNTNTLAQTMALGNSVGSYNLNLNGHQLLNAKLEYLAGPPGTADPGRIWYDSGSDQVEFETAGASNRVVATLDDTQTFSNKSLSGSSNTFTNIPDSALSANMCKLDSTQSITGQKTFSTSPIMSSIKTPSGAVHAITDGLANDTITLNKAVQELEGKTLKSPTLSGSLDFAEYQANHMRLENLASTPAAGHAGRVIYKTATGEVQYDTGTSWLTFQSNAGGAAGWSLAGNTGTDPAASYVGTADATDFVMRANATEAFRITSAGGLKTQLGSGLVKSTSGTLGLAASGTDYAPATSGSAMLKGNGSGGFSSASSGADYAPATSGSAILKGNGSGGFSSASAGTDYSAGTSALATGLLKSTTTTGALSIASSGTDYEVPLTFTVGAGITRSTNTITCDSASGSVKGCLTSADWTTFNGKQAAGNYLTYTANQYGLLASGSGYTASVIAPVASTVYPLISGGAAANPAFGLLTVPGGGTGLATLTAHSIQLGNGTGTPTQLGVGATGTVLTGVTGADPAFSASPSLTGIVLGDGSAGTPALRFTNQTDAGIWKEGSNLLGIGTNGSRKMRIGAYSGGHGSWINLGDGTSGETNGVTSYATNGFTMLVGGASDSAANGQVRVYGDTHATKAAYIEFTKGATVQGYFNANGDLALATTTDSSSTSTGGLNIAGGVGIAKKLYVGSAASLAGQTTVKGVTETVVAGGTCSTSYNVDPTAGTIVTLTLSGACAIGVTNLAAGHSFTIYLTQSSTTAPTFTSAYKWATATVPTFSTSATKYDTIYCGSPDGTKVICGAIVDAR